MELFIVVLLLFAALICAVIAAFNLAARINFLAAAFALFLLAEIIRVWPG